MKENITGGVIATVKVVASSMSINSRLPAQLEKALERNIVLRIGWTTNGDPVLKMRVGIMPSLPEGSKVRSLGLDPFTASFGQGGSFTHQGDVGSFWEQVIMETNNLRKNRWKLCSIWTEKWPNNSFRWNWR